MLLVTVIFGLVSGLHLINTRSDMVCGMKVTIQLEKPGPEKKKNRSRRRNLEFANEDSSIGPAVPAPAHKAVLKRKTRFDCGIHAWR